MSPFMINKTYKCPKATRKTVKLKYASCKIAVFCLIRYNHFVQTTITQQMVQVLTVIYHKTGDYHSAELYDHSAPS